jgi:hypothetical protein
VTSAGTSVTAAQITAALASASANTYVLLGPGTYNFSSGQITFPSKGQVELRGSGANSTFLVIGASAGGMCVLGGAFICVASPDQPYFNQPPPNVCAWTSGYAQGGTSITLAAAGGNCPQSIVTASTNAPTILWLEQCETGLSAASATSACTGTETDNGQLFICSWIYSSSSPAQGCASEGAVGQTSGNQNNNRGQFEGHVATAFNSGTGVATIAPGLIYPQWSSARMPRAWLQKSISTVGIRDMSIDDSSNGSSEMITFAGAYKFWVSGVRFTKTNQWAVFILTSLNGTIKDSYWYGQTGGNSDAMSIRQEGGGNNLFLNNIITQTFGNLIFDGPSSGDVIAYNFEINSFSPNDFMRGMGYGHAVNSYELYEGNIMASTYGGDGDHGSANMITRFRNFIPGWESCANGQCGTITFKDSGTNAINDYYGGRYNHNIANVMGTPGYHTSYQCTTNGNATCVQQVGVPNMPAIGDPLSKTTSIFWGNYDTVSAAVRWCGSVLDTGWLTTCGGISEIPTTLSTLANALPSLGDAAAGQGAMPASFLFSSKPTWFGSNPWPAIGPDVSSGNIGQCSGALNVLGQFNGVAAMTNAQCGGHGITASAWGGHVNANPAMVCYLNTMGGVPDGTGSKALPFDAKTCYSGSVSSGLPPAAPTNLSANVN